MPRPSDGRSRADATVARRIEWGERRRRTRQVQAHPERYVVEDSDRGVLWDIVLQALYVAEAEAERTCLVAALEEVLRAKDAAAKLWRAEQDTGISLILSAAGTFGNVLVSAP